MTWHLNVSTTGPFAVGSCVFRESDGAWVAAIVAKATYRLAPGLVEPLDTPIGVQERDGHWDDDPSRGVHTPGDLAPRKESAEVVVVGGVYPSPSDGSGAVNARIRLGSVDKTVAVSGPRYRLAPDQLGPLPVTSPLRSQGLTNSHLEWLAAPARHPRPADFPSKVFQCAPPDQRLAREVRGGEWIELVHLHRAHPQLTMKLAPFEPRVNVAGRREALPMRGDLMVIDTDRELLTVTFRAHVPLACHGDSPRIEVVASDRSEDESSKPLMTMRTEPAVDSSPRPTPNAPEISDDLTENTEVGLGTPVTDHLPFALASRTATPAWHGADPPPPSPANVAPHSASDEPKWLAPSRVFASSPQSVAPLATASSAHAYELAPASSDRSSTGHFESNRKSGMRAESSENSRTRKRSPMAGLREAAVLPPSELSSPPADAAGGGALTRAAREVPVTRMLVVDLLHHASALPGRLRSSRALGPLLSTALRPPGPLTPDEPRRPPPDPDRELVLRALTYLPSCGIDGIRAALAGSLDDGVSLELPLLVVHGELCPTFDELETLRASMLVGASIAGTDKRMLATLAVAEEALEARLPPPPETLVSLTRALENAASGLPVAPDFLATNAARVLLEGRHYKRRTLLGAPRLRTELRLAEGKSVITYLPADVADGLPLLPSFPVVVACEVRPREDHVEAAEVALFALAVGRVLARRRDSRRHAD